MTRFSNRCATFSVFVGLAVGAAAAHAQTHDMHEHAAASMATAAKEAPGAAMTAGEIKKVDKDTGTLTIQHGPITNLGMPGMTMVFKVQDPAVLGQVKAGDKIRFHVELVNGVMTVTKLELAS